MSKHTEAIRDALAAGPTPGPWYLRTNRHPTTDGRAWGWLDTQPPGGGQYAPPGLQITWERGSKSEANADYIAACNPAAITALLADLDAARADAERLSSLAYPPFCDEYNEVDLHEQAAIYASAFGREEPNRDDYLAALRDAVDAALAQADAALGADR